MTSVSSSNPFLNLSDPFIGLVDTAPIRAELFGLEHLEAHARDLAAASPAGWSRHYPSLLSRFQQNSRILIGAYRRIAKASAHNEELSPDAEWLLDNYYVIEEVLREIRLDLPRGFYKELPKLASGPLAGYPRIYALALALVAHTDSNLDERYVTRFVQAYQTIAPLTIGELWAVPTMFRLVLVENLRSLSEQMLEAWDERARAEKWAAEHAKTERQALPSIGDPKIECLSDGFVTGLLPLLRDPNSALASLAGWLEDHLSYHATNTAEVLRREQQRQAANQVSIGNCITSLRLLSALDWNEFFEKTSLVEKVLRKDPAQVYARQDFATRDRYRRVVEKLARGSQFSEIEIADEVGVLAGAAPQGDIRRRHIGYYLIDQGHEELEARINYVPRIQDTLLSLLLEFPNSFYFGSLIACVTVLVVALLVSVGWSGQGLLVLSATIIPISALAVAFVNFLVTQIIPPRVLPKFNFKEGVPPDCSTCVVVPSLLSNPQSVNLLADRLELHYLTNPDPHFHFALLTDFSDSPNQNQPEDEILIRQAREKIQELNLKHGANGETRFSIFHRERRWNEAQGCWMGWERKRGKLIEFNRFLRGATDTSYKWAPNDAQRLVGTRFVLTLDADTQLPREAVQRLVATLAHPLNQPRLDPETKRVVDGYAVLQPRVNFTISSALRSLFAKIFSTSKGIDPYAVAVSDVYQDLFGAGSFTGKGLYDVDAFEGSVGNRFPDNHILSHDLIESNFARCGLVTDIEIMDDFPPRYHTYMRREHRWARGDWQLLPWLFLKVPAPDRRSSVKANSEPNTLGLLERWKTLDNMRRTLVPPALLVMLLLGWTVLPGSGWLWSGFGLFVLALPLVFLILGNLIQCLRSVSLKPIMIAFREDVLPTSGQVLLTAIFLADQARLMIDAIGRTICRLYVSRRLLLEWETAASTERRLSTDLQSFARTMWPALLIAGLFVGLICLFSPQRLPSALPFVGLWLLSPFLAYIVSRPYITERVELTPEDEKKLRRLARKTWNFFETFVGDEDHWLPPDNFQEDPKSMVAHRTSPTNKGLLLLSTLAAHDLGYISLTNLLTRLEKSFETLEKLDRYRGHFHNWYDTRTLKSLPPVYISTVDSGNLMACLLVLKQGLNNKRQEVIPNPAMRQGLKDTFNLVRETIHKIEPPEDPEHLEVFEKLNVDLREVNRLLEENAENLLKANDWLHRLLDTAKDFPDRTRQLNEMIKDWPDSVELWIDRFLEQLAQNVADVNLICPWIRWLKEHPSSNFLPDDLKTLGESLITEMTTPVSLVDFEKRLQSVQAKLADLGEKLAAKQVPQDWVKSLQANLQTADPLTAQKRIDKLMGQCDDFAEAMDFKFLYNADRNLFSIGFNLSQNRLDSSYYDLLASEACLASFLAIARGDAPVKHWFQLGRLFSRVAGQTVLLSWGGTMFEFLMPRLLLRPYAGTILNVACQAAVARQIQYGKEKGVPWGMSESAFNFLDGNLDYQYRSFGVPGLGLKRGLGHDLVIAPYATALALAIQPKASLFNLEALEREGGVDRHGFYEALDYTKQRLLKGERVHVVKSHMAHHQGMCLLAMANRLLNDIMPRRFHADPLVRSADLLLQERVPPHGTIRQPLEREPAPTQVLAERPKQLSRRLKTAATPTPRTHLLSNGAYSVMITNSGAGYSTCDGHDVTRWREDQTRDCWGQFCYLRDLHTGLTWSAGHQPIGRSPSNYEVAFYADKAEIKRWDTGIETQLEIAVSPENNIEVRQLTLTNLTRRRADLEITSYAEVVLNPHAADLSHPVFGSIFLETEWLPGSTALLCRRRPRSEDQTPVWGLHVLALEAMPLGKTQFETDRARFLGRNRTRANPLALEQHGPLSGTSGPVLDPIFSIRQAIRLEPGTTARLVFSTGLVHSREEAVALADRFHDVHAASRAFELAWAHAQVELRHLQMSPEDLHLFQRLAGHIIFAHSALRAPAAQILANRQGQSSLWRHGISGDRPIVVVRIAELEQLALVQQTLNAHTYWRLKGLEVDLVILNDHPTSYHEELHEQLQNLAMASDAHRWLDKPGGVFLRKAAQISDDDRVLVLAAARVVLVGERGTLANQLDALERVAALPILLHPRKRPEDTQKQIQTVPSREPKLPDLLFKNGLGGFTKSGKEYMVRLDPGGQQHTPAPWVNVIANPRCGFLVSECGSGYSWVGNSQTNKITPWSNDPITDPAGEVIYIRDESTGEIWSPTPQPIQNSVPILVRHGQGYSTFEHIGRGIYHELVLFVPPEDSVKLFRLKLRNLRKEKRSLSAVFYAEWVLGANRDASQMHICTEIDPETGVVLARNAFNPSFSAHVAFADVNLEPRTVTADRTEFLGRNGSISNPAALSRKELSGRVGAALDPCVAIQAKFDLQPGEEKEIVFLLGQAPTLGEVRQLVRRYRKSARANAALADIRQFWDNMLSTIQVKTPNPALDLLVNRWLLYQVLSCRIWGRSAFYQSGGAYGFRDQLQDVMALIHCKPKETRDQIIRAASRQFLEGDVQHWWHPPEGRGVRTRFSDDFLWLPFVVSHYVEATGDYGLLDESVPFLRAPLLEPGQEESYGLPQVTDERGTVYEHCLRSLKNAFKWGSHGLPLMGTGDWNDGMNRVGSGGKGESVWDAWFLIDCLKRFKTLAESRKDAEWAASCGNYIERLRTAVEDQAWDGQWYRRAYFDDGTPLGSTTNEECQIDSIAQTWAVISGAADPGRASLAMNAVEKRLIQDKEKLILLFTPPFDKSKLNPGYIKGYIPGVRENGGQYTHASVWVLLATALQKKGKRAIELFDMLNPINHAQSPESAALYKVEPYVVAADVYSQPPHTGRGGWTWYTGS
ncbi:MAG TPA: glucoamylase family protein, partial [Gemmataceae bacterium]|nr:glucoamylase family protein [Gemmataceae bacterium]